MAHAQQGTRAVSRPRSPAFVQIVLTVVIAALLVAVTLTTRQPPPPAIAEFAPQAAEQIKEQPKEQASQFGSGAGAGDCPPGADCAAGDGAGVGAGGGTTTTVAEAATTVPPKISPASLKRCVGDPPRQIEDPQSPPCVAYWDDSKGNGGATSPGVTADTITIAAPEVGDEEQFNAYQRFFNNRFQFYGRQIKWVLTGKGVAGADKAKQVGAFAATASYNDMPLYRQLARHKIIGIYRTPDFADSELARSAPYLWGYLMSFTQMLGNLGEWACNRLSGHKARHAGEIDGQPLSGYDRTFAILLDTAVDSSAEPSVLQNGLQQCGAGVPVVERWKRFDEDPIRIRNQVVRLKGEHVTSVFCLCALSTLTQLQSQASSQDYEPEWIVTNYPQFGQGEGYNGPQADRTFGVSFQPRDRVKEDHPAVWAEREGDPANANAIAARDEPFTNSYRYQSWLALASGIQMAGPNLTPETFRAGLQRTRFPNPDHPIMAGKVGFNGDFSMTDDGAEFWMSTKDEGPYGPQHSPAFCWVDGGRRHRRGTWPKSPEAFYQGPCDVGNKSVS